MKTNTTAIGLGVLGAGVLNFFRRKPRNDAADGPA